MYEDPKRLEELLNKYTHNEMNEPEFNELCELIKEQGNEAVLKNMLQQGMSRSDFDAMDKKKLDRMLGKILRSLPRLSPEAEELVRRLFPWRKVAIAASIILILGVGAYFLFSNKTEKKTEILSTNVLKDVKAPENNRAMLTLTNGQKVYLDSVANGELAMQGNVKLVKLANGEIVYQTASGEISKEIKYNTLENPRGSRVVSMTLADGSKVWLNSGSSLTYPVAFVGNERKVSITGEAYFEVAHNSSMPFYVTRGETAIQVLGTHFNVNAYADEAAIRVTLLEGSVKISKGSTIGFLKPGEQATISSDIKIVDDVDMEETMAWKNGKFQFGEAADIVTIMKQISRWYDLDVEYNGVIKEHIGGTISRDVNASQVFKMLELTGVVTFQIDGKKVTVMPK